MIAHALIKMTSYMVARFLKLMMCSVDFDFPSSMLPKQSCLGGVKWWQRDIHKAYVFLSKW